MWFNSKDLKFKKIIKLPDLHGYVLPHAGTEFTGTIISHTLRFRPINKIKKVIIFYYPANSIPTIEFNSQLYFHEYYVPWQSMKTLFRDDTIRYEGINVGTLDVTVKKPNLDENGTMTVVSADFSHFMPFQKAMDLENKAAHALMFRELTVSPPIKVIDDVKTFNVVYHSIPTDWFLQWVGRDRSSGLKAVGYLSFLLREQPYPTKKMPDGMFITVYSKDMVAHECLGEWFNKKHYWTKEIETQLKEKVIYLGGTTSRLTGGQALETPLTHYTITYLYKDKMKPFIRGWHGIRRNAFYLPEVFLENTFNNGLWINSADTEWRKKPKDVFNLNETFKKLTIKSSLSNNRVTRKKENKNYSLYHSSVVHYSI